MQDRASRPRLVAALDSAPNWLRPLLAICVVMVAAMFAMLRPALAVDEAEAASGPPFNVAVFVSSRGDACYESGNVAAIKRLTSEVERGINKRGGILGRPVNVVLYDDERDEQKSIQNVHAALADPRTLAMVGLSGSTRPTKVFEAMGEDIAKSGVPFLSDISNNKIFEKAKNVYTTRASQEDDRIPIMVGFPKKVGYQRPAFAGIKDNVGATGLADGLQVALAPSGGLAGNYPLTVADDKVVLDDVTAMAADLKAKNVDMLYLGVGGTNAAFVISQLVSAGVTPALFVSGNLELIPSEVANSYPNAIYALGWETPPEEFNNRIRTYIAQQNGADWVFEGAKIPTAPGWAKGECTERPVVEFPDPFNPENRRAISVGSQYADMVSLVTQAARSGQKTTDIRRLRERILEALGSTYASGRGFFRGTFSNWAFVSSSRSAARSPFVIILPQGLGRAQLAPVQFVRSRDGTLRQIETLYTDIDLIQAHRVDENDKTFYAEFYLSMRNNDAASIDRVEFSNAYLETGSDGGRQVTIETLHPGGASPAFPPTMKIYKVSGRFLFDPKLRNYPFDTQIFSIDIQPKESEKPFIVQPPPAELRDKLARSEGWEPKAQFVGYEEDFVPVVDAYTLQPSAVPFYKTSFAWEMRRQTTDYVLRVAVPLGFILFVAYLSIFIPRSNFEAIVTIQVTALLSAVALYLALPKLDSDVATLSDRAFVFAYMILSVMIAISILRVSPLVGERKGPQRLLEIGHIAVVPVFVVVAALYGYQLSQATPY